MGLARLQGRFPAFFRQRCFYPFASLLALIIAILFALDSEQGRIVIGLAQRLEAGAFGIAPGGVPRTFHDLLFMSFGALTSNGPGGPACSGSRFLP